MIYKYRVQAPRRKKKKKREGREKKKASLMAMKWERESFNVPFPDNKYHLRQMKKIHKKKGT